MSATEILGFVTGAASVWLAVRENVWNWPIGIANSAFFLVLFWASHLYANALLQILYIALGLYGWWNWLRGGTGHTALSVRRVRRVEAVVLFGATVATAVALKFTLDEFTDNSAPLWDGLTVALSLTATYMLTVKVLESWWIWIVTDLIYIPLCAATHLYLTSVVYGLFLTMCIVGLVKWTRAYRASELDRSAPE